MPSRMNREQFFDRLDAVGADDLKKVLWTVYWRGTAPMRERIEEALEPQRRKVRKQAADRPREAAAVLEEVREFAALARSGAYVAGDRRVSRQERSRWRHTFRRFAKDAHGALRGRDLDSATIALAALIDLACECREFDYFHSEDPVEAARFVVSDAVTAMWARLRDEQGAQDVAVRAPEQLVHWESRYGWTRRGDGWVAEREASLASTLSGFLGTPDLWSTAARHYLDALDQVGRRERGRGGPGRRAATRAADLSEWNMLLVRRLIGSEDEGLLDKIVAHPALGGPELIFVQAVLARERRDLDAASELVRTALRILPGHPDLRRFADELDELRDVSALQDAP